MEKVDYVLNPVDNKVHIYMDDYKCIRVLPLNYLVNVFQDKYSFEDEYAIGHSYIFDEDFGWYEDEYEEHSRYVYVGSHSLKTILFDRRFTDYMVELIYNPNEALYDKQIYAKMTLKENY